MHGTTLHNIEELKERYDCSKQGKQSLLHILEEAELPEAVYNSNAIENSTLSLDETEQILLHQSLPPHSSQREVFEAINLGKITQYLDTKMEKGILLSRELILFVHSTLMSHIHDDIGGKFRCKGQYVRVGKHIAPPPEKVSTMMNLALEQFEDPSIHPLDRIIQFHVLFEHIHPFLDGNGRVGRALLNFQLKLFGYPPIIIRNKEKKEYYEALRTFDSKKDTKPFERIFALLLKESLHKRIAYLEGDDIVYVSEMSAGHPVHSPQAIANAAKKQSLPAFRERGRWKVGRNGFAEWEEGHRHG